MARDPLQRYRAKRDFARTPEPSGAQSDERPATGVEGDPPLSFVVQKHAARQLHYDFRLELDGAMLSWAVPKGPSLDPADKRMAVHVEDHPISYNSFEGTIPPGQYGAGTVIVWDRGWWRPLVEPHQGLAEGKLPFTLHGAKLAGDWELIRLKPREGDRQEHWLLFKKRDAHARARAEFDVIAALPDSVIGGGRRSARSPRSARPARPPASADADEGEAAPDCDVDEPARLPGAIRRALPASLAPQLAGQASTPPPGSQWTYEIKFDGYRLMARIEGGRVALITRGRQDWTRRMPELAGQLAALPLESAWLDGEITVLDRDGLPRFDLLQGAFDDGPVRSRIVYFVFDLPYLDGHDLRRVPLVQRRALLRTRLVPLQGRSDGPVRFSEGFLSDPASIVASARRMKLEGLMAKRNDAPYVSGRGDTWLKVKFRHRQEFVIGGFNDRGDDPQAAEIGSLILGVHDGDGRLLCVGSVGTGWDAATAARLKHVLAPLRISRNPFANEVPVASRGRRGDRPAGGGHWVRPTQVAQVVFGAWTDDGRIRQAVFEGLRDDKPAREVVREPDPVLPEPMQEPMQEPGPGPGPEPGPGFAEAPTQSTVRVPMRAHAPAADESALRVSHPERVIDPQTGLTKLDLVRYYRSVADWMLPHLRGRPSSMVRAPDGLSGELFFQKHLEAARAGHSGAGAMPGVRQLDAALWPGHPPMIEIVTAQGLLGAAQLNVIEFHTGNARAARFDRPDRVVFDLDPGPEVPWSRVQEAAQLVHGLLQELGLRSWLKTSGGKGLHVVVPLAPRHPTDAVFAFSGAVARHLARVIPDRFVAVSGERNRQGRIFVDFLRNRSTATTVAAYSARARPGLGVSMPVNWSMLPQLRGGAHWSVVDAREHLSLNPVDPWDDYWRCRQTLATAVRRLGLPAPE